MIDRNAIFAEATEEVNAFEKTMELTLDLTIEAVVKSIRKAAQEWDAMRHHTAAQALRQFALELENDSHL